MTDHPRQPSLFIPSTGMPLLHLRQIAEAPTLRGRVGIHLTLPTLTRHGIQGCADTLGVSSPFPRSDTARVLASVRGPRDDEERDEIVDLLSAMASAIPTLDGILLDADASSREWTIVRQQELTRRKPAGPTLYVPSTPTGITHLWECPDTSAGRRRVTCGVWLDHLPMPRGGTRALHPRREALVASLIGSCLPLGTLLGMVEKMPEITHHLPVLDARLLQGKDIDVVARLIADACQQVEDAHAARRHRQREAETVA